jgi:hypothetical protein
VAQVEEAVDGHTTTISVTSTTIGLLSAFNNLFIWALPFFLTLQARKIT